MEKVCSYIKKGLVILFVPMFFASIMFFTQTITVYIVLKHMSGLKTGEFVIKNITSDATGGAAGEGGTSSFTDYEGEINGRQMTIWRGDVRSFTHIWSPKVGDTIYVWYSDESKFIRPRNKEEAKFNPLKYMYEGYRWFMFTTIPVYIMLIIAYKKLKKKLRKNETK